ncbi:MAG: metalloregulator ArsR/SmtB family transcription factor [Coriobacteriia bacterium]|nr:metalloregulator ArsR/SmtB family transcription factor [Coriobacteriia bacterium]
MSDRSYDKDSRGDLCEAVVSDEAAVRAARKHVPGEETVAATTEMFAALADPTRLRILLALGCCELCVCDLAALTGISQSGVSHQLRFLRDLRLVAFRREGKRALYRLCDAHVATLLAQGVAHAKERETESPR